MVALQRTTRPAEPPAYRHRRAGPCGEVVSAFRRTHTAAVPIGGFVLATAAIVGTIELVLHLPGIPYNVAELFLNNGSVVAVGFFAMGLLWIGAGAMMVAIALTSTRRP